MKWSVIALFALGVVAAICAAMLVTSIQVGAAAAAREVQAQESAASEVQVVVAARPLEALSVIEASAVTTRFVPAGEAAADVFADTTLVIGKVLLRSVSEGQLISTGLLAHAGSGVHVASALRPGMRAVSIALSDSMGLEGLLYPGSVVDVIASINLRATDDVQARPVSMTLLQGVFVLGVGERTVVSEPEGEALVSGASGRRRPNVTLLVDLQQAEVLKLAMQEGSVSLVLRNPTDESIEEAEGTSLSSLSPVLEVPPAPRQIVVTKGGVPQVQTFRIAGGE